MRDGEVGSADGKKHFRLDRVRSRWACRAKGALFMARNVEVIVKGQCCESEETREPGTVCRQHQEPAHASDAANHHATRFKPRTLSKCPSRLAKAR